METERVLEQEEDTEKWKALETHLITIGNVIVIEDRDKDLVNDQHDKDHYGDEQCNLHPEHIRLGRNRHNRDARELAERELQVKCSSGMLAAHIPRNE